MRPSGTDRGDLIIAIIAGLAALLFFLGVRWNMAKTENEQLRLQIASLKRQLKQLGRPG
jgi:hypothetical protein